MSLVISKLVRSGISCLSRRILAPQSFASRTNLRGLVTSQAMRKVGGDWFNITYEVGDGSKHTVPVKDGDNLLDVVINNDIDIDGFGACEGTLACSTCHIVFTEEDFAKLDDEATDEELDMLDLAYGLTDTSRLGCQVCMTKELDGITVLVPEGINDQR